MPLESGMTSDYVEVSFSQEDSDQFNRSLGMDENNPHFHQASPTLPIQMMIDLDSPWKEDIPMPLIHGKQTFDYQEPLKLGEKYLCRLRLDKVRPMKSKGQEALMFEQIIEGYQADELKFSCTSLLIGYQKGEK